MTVKSALTSTTTRARKAEKNRKTMLKVMDPNVHQMTLSRNLASQSDEEDMAASMPERRSDLTGTRTVIVKQSIEPKIEMKRKLAR